VSGVMQYSYSLLIMLLVSIVFFSILTFFSANASELESFSLEHAEKVNQELLEKEILISPLNITVK
jgi:hypothetical protein